MISYGNIMDEYQIPLDSRHRLNILLATKKLYFVRDYLIMDLTSEAFKVNDTLHTQLVYTSKI